MATFVLVHGGSQGSWAYKQVARMLRAEGHEVYCPTLTGTGDRRHLVSAQIDLDTHIEDVVQLLFHEDLTDVYLAGHSYGGMVITGVADRALERIGHLVYLDASHPKDGEALTDVAPGMMQMAYCHMKVVDGVELIELPPETAQYAYDSTRPEIWEWARPRLSPHMWKCFISPLHLTREDQVRKLPRTSINCTPTLAARPPELLHRAFEADHVFEIDTTHNLMMTEPLKLADMLLEIVAREEAGARQQ